MNKGDRAPSKAIWLVGEAWVLGVIIAAGYIEFGSSVWSWFR